MSGRPHAVLILDDDEAVRESFADYLGDRGWRVLSAATGEEALGVLGHETPDCAVVDIRLPGMDGNEFIRKAIALHPGLGFVVCTGSPDYSMPSDLAALPGGGDVVFCKPIADMALLEQELHRRVERLNSSGDALE